MHQTLVDEITELGELRAVDRHARIVINKDMGVWHGIAFLLRQRLTCLNLCWQGILSVCLIRGRDTRIDGGHFGVAAWEGPCEVWTWFATIGFDMTGSPR